MIRTSLKQRSPRCLQARLLRNGKQATTGATAAVCVVRRVVVVCMCMCSRCGARVSRCMKVLA
jgi:hypothetical protein